MTQLSPVPGVCEGKLSAILICQFFPPRYPDVCANNAIYVNALGKVGRIYIRVFTRFLFTFLLDSSTQPTPANMRLWVDRLREVRRFNPTRAWEFFTYGELMVFFCRFCACKPKSLALGLVFPISGRDSK